VESRGAALPVQQMRLERPEPGFAPPPCPGPHIPCPPSRARLNRLLEILEHVASTAGNITASFAASRSVRLCLFWARTERSRPTASCP